MTTTTWKTDNDVDVTPGEHGFLDALGTVSFTLGCGCRTNHSEPDWAIRFKRVGHLYPCEKHGEQVITRATVRLTGWKPLDPAMEELFQAEKGA
jgi:hypothetical protein